MIWAADDADYPDKNKEVCCAAGLMNGRTTYSLGPIPRVFIFL
jgi:hypothetical protein